MKEVIFTIPDMQSAHCQTRVHNAVKDIKGVRVEKMEAGKLTASLENEEAGATVINAIEKAGYHVTS
ncbi:MAG: heavy-metal-associated domain-containing protein [Chitinophagaceae bacterium]|nr:heavy-metal-associated domain-containing protein [Chitinophagaceae bacterium]